MPNSFHQTGATDDISSNKNKLRQQQQQFLHNGHKLAPMVAGDESLRQTGALEQEQRPLPQLDTNTQQGPDVIKTSDGPRQPQPGVADILGEFGLYQLSLTLLTFVRYICVAMMTNSGPLIAPEVDFVCLLPNSTIEQLVDRGNASSLGDYLTNRCQVDLVNSSLKYECNQFKFSHKLGVTLTDSFQLVCQRDWLRSALQSTISIGVVFASVLGGIFSDTCGRKSTVNICFALSLASGLISYLAPYYIIYAISRAFCSMSDLALVASLATILIETLGNKFRGTACLIVYTGWSIGVMVMPWCVDYFANFRHLMLFTIACHLITLPWLLTVSESIRWLLVNGRIEMADAEVGRILNWNCAGESAQDQARFKFGLFKRKFVNLIERKNLKQLEQLDSLENSTTLTRRTDKPTDRQSSGGVYGAVIDGLAKIGQLFKSKGLTTTTLTIIWTTFNSELLYMLFIMINSDIGDNVKLNYAIGGLMETLATLISIWMVASLSRRFSLSSTLIVIASSCFCLAFTHQYKGLSIWTLNFTKLAISTLSSLVYVVATELFPTSLRQTGIGLAATLGSLGAVVAPFIRTELTNIMGMTNVLLILCSLPLSAAIVIPIFLRETKGIELADDLDELDSNDCCNCDRNSTRAEQTRLNIP